MMQSGLVAVESDRIEELVDRLVVELAREERRQVDSLLGRPFAEHMVVIPTTNLETYLQFEIAARLGVASGLKFTTVQPFLEGLLPVDEEGNPLVRVLDTPTVTRLLISVLSDEEVLQRPVLEPVREFIRAASDGSAELVERRRFQLASRVARLFEEYGYSRRELLDRWAKGEPGLKDLFGRGDGRVKSTHLTIESWQMALWDELYGARGKVARLREELGEGLDWRTLPDAIHFFATDEEAIKAGRGLRWPQCVHVFGQSYLPRFFRDLFAMRTYAEGRIIIYVMNPCLEHWSHGVAGDRDEDPVFEILAEESPLSGDEYSLPLELWGRAGRDFQRMLDEIAYDREDVSRRREREEHTLLQSFQSMIRELKTAREVFTEQEVPRDRKSLQFWSCANVQRECESIASEIWEMVQTHENLRFNDIAVVVQPGKRTIYQTHLQAAFAQTGGIPCNIIDVQGAQTSAFLEGAQLLLELPLGKFRRRELLSFLVHPCVVANYPEADAGAWMKWCEALNIYQGGGKEELGDTYLSRDRFTWEQGMRRLLLGAFMSQTDRDRPRAFEVGGEPYLVHETSQGQMEAAATMVMVVDELVAKSRRVRAQKRPIREWMEYFRAEITRHLAFRDRREERVRMQLLGRLSEIGGRDICADESVGYRTAFEFAAGVITDMEESYGQYLADGVVVSAFRPMRPIPFQVVFVTGLGESEFPAPEPPDMLDLRRVRSQMHDVNPRYQDQYMFLETLMSTRSRLILSWVGRHEVTGDKLEPASVVHQLKESILAMAPTKGERAIRVRDELKERVRDVEQPLRRYDRRYFPEIFGDEPLVIDAGGPDGIEPGPEGERGSLEARKERVFPNHHREARQEARARVARQRLDERVPAGYGPTMGELDEVLAREVFEELSGILRWERPREERAGVEADKIVLQLHHLRKFLECPLQGSARALLRLYDEDDEDVEDVDHEPFEADFLTRLNLVREVMEEALSREEVDLSREKLEEIFDEFAEAAELGGGLPSGVYFKAERERCLGELTTYLSAIRGEDDGELRLRRVRFGAARERENVDEVREPLSFEVELPGSEGRRVVVEVHGLVKVMEKQGKSSLIWAGGGSAKAKYFVRGAVEQMALKAAGLGASGVVDVVTTKGKRETRQLEEIDQMGATEYLGRLSRELLSEVHDYFLPVEMVEAIVKGRDEDLERLERKNKEKDYRTKRYLASSQYGPVRRWQDSPLPSTEKIQEILQGRYGPIRTLLMKGGK